MSSTKPDDALLDLFEETVEKKVTKVDDKQLKSLAENMNAMLELGGQVGNAEEKLKQLKEKYRQYSEEIIPEQMQSMGLSSLSMDDGSRVSVDPFYSARITEKNKQEAHEWLRKNGLGDLIKNTVSVDFVTGEDEIAQKLMSALEKQGMLPSQREAVHPSTLRAEVKRLVESGETAFDSSTQKLFSVYTGQRTKIIKS